MCNNLKILICVFLLSVGSNTKVLSQSFCPNSDFSLNTFDNWIITHGNFNTCCNQLGPIWSRARIEDSLKVDWLADNALTNIPVGFTNSLRLGSPSSGAQADRAIYNLQVDENNARVELHFAVVFEDPFHATHLQPRFDIRVLNDLDSVISSTCGTYELVPDFWDDFFFISYNYPFHVVLYTQWITQSVDLTPFIGQNIQLEFTTRDCALSGHFGYAYLNFSCFPQPKLKLETCISDSIFLISAPPHFQNYLWSNGDTTQMAEFNLNQSNFVQVQLTSLVGCVTTIDTILSKIIVSANFTNSLFCDNDSTFFTDLSTSTAGAINKWQWDFGDNNSSNLQHPSHQWNNKVGHNVELQVQNDIGCKNDTIIFIKGLPSPNIDFNHQPDSTDILAPNFEFNSVNLDNQIIDFYHWNFAGLDTDTLQHTSFTFPDTGYYPVTLMAINNFDCRDSVTHTMAVSDIATIYIPNSFTPNNDGINDVFLILGLEIKSIDINIYSRFGELIFESNDILNSWDGKNTPQGVYVYRVAVVFTNNQQKIVNGTITLIR